MAPLMPPQGPFFPISELSAYHSNWTIRARVTTRGPMRQFAARSGGAPGKVFHVELLDADGGEIRANFFGLAADYFYERLLPGKCFTLRGGAVRIANQRFNTCKHRYELVFDKAAGIEESADDSKIQAIKLSPTDLRSLQSRALPCTVDLCGIIVSFHPVMSFTSREGKELVKRDIVIADDTATSMTVAIWGDRAKQEERVFEGNPLVGLKGVAVKEWNGGRSGSLSEGGSLMFEPAVPEAVRLRQWWSQGGSAQGLTALSQTTGGAGGARTQQCRAVSLAEMRKAAEHVLAQPEVFTVVCRLALVQTKKQGEAQPLYYMACQEPKEGSGYPCNKRVDASGFCAACGRAGRAAPRLTLRCRFADCDDSAWLTTFHEAAERVLALKAEEAQCMERGESGREALEAAIRRRLFFGPLQLTVRAKMDSYNGESRTNLTCVEARPVPLREHGRVLLRELKEMLA